MDRNLWGSPKDPPPGMNKVKILLTSFKVGNLEKKCDKITEHFVPL